MTPFFSASVVPHITETTNYLTVLVARLPEGLPFGEDDGHHQILEGGDIEEGGVLVVPDVFMVRGRRHVKAAIEPGSGAVAGAAGGREHVKEVLHVSNNFHLQPFLNSCF